MKSYFRFQNNSAAVVGLVLFWIHLEESRSGWNSIKPSNKTCFFQMWNKKVWVYIGLLSILKFLSQWFSEKTKEKKTSIKPSVVVIIFFVINSNSERYTCVSFVYVPFLSFYTNPATVVLMLCKRVNKRVTNI